MFYEVIIIFILMCVFFLFLFSRCYSIRLLQLNYNQSMATSIDDNRPCVVCHASTDGKGPKGQRRSYLLTMSFTDKRPFILDYIGIKYNNEIELDDEDRICRPCFQRAQRWNQRINSKEAIQVYSDAEAYVSDFGESENDEDIGTGSRQSTTDKATQTKSHIIQIPEYFRAPNTTVSCIIINCTNHNLHRIKTSIRADILSKKNVYLPRTVCICGHHRDSNVWPNIENLLRHKYKAFNAVQIADMFSLLKSRPKKKRL